MKTKSGFPYAELVFDKEAKIEDSAGFDELLDEVATGEPADVLVFVHGWNNDIDEARGWYGELAARFREVLDGPHAPAVGNRRLMILGVLWPSKKWAERSLIPGGAASVVGSPADEEVQGRLDALKGVFDADDADDRLERAKALVPQLENDPAAQDEFVNLIRGVVPAGAANDPDDFAAALLDDKGREILGVLSQPPPPDIDRDGGGGAAGGVGGGVGGDEGGAAGLFSLSGIKAAAERLLNLTTYYQMKERAGIVGATGLNPALRRLHERRAATRLHLIGHSFGGRLVAATTMGDPAKPALSPHTVTLLQAAFSHYGFADDYEASKDGYFRPVVTGRMSRGPVLITHSKRDKAVGYAYPLASRLARQVAAALGDANDRYGGIGRNGAQKTPEAVAGTLEAVGGAYAFANDKLYNLNADATIADHSDIRRPEVAFAVLTGIAGSPIP